MITLTLFKTTKKYLIGLQTLFLEEATCHRKKLVFMKNSTALGVPSWKSSSLTWGLLTVYLHVDCILDQEVCKSQGSF